MKAISTFYAAALRVGVDYGYVLDGALGKVGNQKFCEADGGSPPSRRPGVLTRVAVALSALKRVVFSSGKRREIMRKEGADIYNRKLCQNLLGTLTADMSSAGNVARVRKTLDRMRSRTSGDRDGDTKWTALLDEAISRTSPRDREAIMAGVADLRRQLGLLKRPNSPRQYLNDIEKLALARQYASEHVKPQGKRSVQFSDAVQTMLIPPRSAEAVVSDTRHSEERDE